MTDQPESARASTDDARASWLLRTMLAPTYQQSVAFSGQVLFTTFRTPYDLTPWVPEPLVLADPHRAFVKVYRLRMRPLDSRPTPPAYSQYVQVCLTVLAAPPGEPLGHYNLLLWEVRDWSIGSNVLGWQKKLATIDTTWLYPVAGHYDADAETDLYQADVHLAGAPMLTLRARLDGSRGEENPGISGGFFSVSHRGDGDPGRGTATADVTRVDVSDCVLGPPVTGQGSLQLFQHASYSEAENALMLELGSPEVTGVALRDVRWVRTPQPPARWTFAPRIDV